MTIGSDRTRLIVLRGNSGSGKSTVATALREAYGHGVAWVSQDLIRRTILKEQDRPGGVNIGLASVQERIIPETSTLQQIVDLILADTQLLGAVAQELWAGLHNGGCQ